MESGTLLLAVFIGCEAGEAITGEGTQGGDGQERAALADWVHSVPA